MRVIVKNTNGKKTEYTVEETDQISRLKALINEKEGIEPAQQR